jgi:hypothetical protein
VIDAQVERGHRAMARVLFGHLRDLLNYAIDRGEIEHSPLDRVRPSSDAVIGPQVERDRVLTDPELVALWYSCDDLEYGPLWRSLL